MNKEEAWNLNKDIINTMWTFEVTKRRSMINKVSEESKDRDV